MCGLTMQKWKIRRIRRAVWESTGAINPRWAEAADHSAFSRLVPIADYLGFKIIAATGSSYLVPPPPQIFLLFSPPTLFRSIKKMERLCAPCAHYLRLSCNLTNLTVWVVIAESNSCKGKQLTCSSADAKKQSWPKASGTGLIHLFRAAFGLHPNWSRLTNAKLLYLIPSVAA